MLFVQIPHCFDNSVLSCPVLSLPSYGKLLLCAPNERLLPPKKIFACPRCHREEDWTSRDSPKNIVFLVQYVLYRGDGHRRGASGSKPILQYSTAQYTVRYGTVLHVPYVYRTGTVSSLTTADRHTLPYGMCSTTASSELGKGKRSQQQDLSPHIVIVIVCCLLQYSAVQYCSLLY